LRSLIRKAEIIPFEDDAYPNSLIYYFFAFKEVRSYEYSKPFLGSSPLNCETAVKPQPE